MLVGFFFWSEANITPGVWIGTLEPLCPVLGPDPGLRFSYAGSPSVHWVAGLMAATVSARRLPMGVRTFSDFLQIATVGSPRACRTPVPRGCMRQNIRWDRHGDTGVLLLWWQTACLSVQCDCPPWGGRMVWEGYIIFVLSLPVLHKDKNFGIFVAQSSLF